MGSWGSMPGVGFRDSHSQRRAVVTARQGQRYRTAVSCLIAAAGLSGLLGCRGEPKGTLVARVGAARLTLQDIESHVPVQIAGKVTAREKKRLVEGWVEEELLYQEALRRKLDEDPDVAIRVSRATRDLLIAELLEREFRRDADVSGDDIRSYYEAQQEEFIRDEPEIRVRHILVKSRSERNRVWERLQNGERFDQVAREASLDASADVGGDLGYFTEDMVDPSFWEVCQKAKPGRQIPTVSRLGHHVIEVLNRRETGSVKELSEVWGEIRQRILAERRQARRFELLTVLRNRVPWSVALDAIGVKRE